MPALVIDLGGTHLRCAVARDGLLRNISRSRVDNFTAGHSAAHIWASLGASIERYHHSTFGLLPAGAPIVMAFPGPVGRRGEILDAPTLVGPGAEMPDLATDLSARTGRPVRLLNDVSAAAWYLSSTTAARRFMVVTVSSGIGGKMFDCSRGGVFDDPPYSGEIGHVVVDARADAPLCGCGGRGHLGMIASGRGTERLAREIAATDPRAFARSLCATRFGAEAEMLSNEQHLAPAARAGDAWALDVVRAAAEPLARVLVTIITAAGLEKVFVVGGFAESVGPNYLEVLRDLVEKFCQYSLLQGQIRTILDSAPAAGDACLHGAALYADSVTRAI